ncbi:MAG: GNAT family N-acetyltransferase [Cyclobacteriaceae bacterium]|jgi:ribosomal protein S18 acetylase RimI-like enzyme|nr:GNAT family N-acetyltransferase [Cyclobacteriaceae bacterium]
MTFKTVRLDTSHNRENFSCGKDPLDFYLKKQVNQDIKRKLSACFVLEGDGHSIKGYYTLSNDSVPLAIVPEEIKKKMPASYINLPTTLIGRLAVDTRFRGQRSGELLLMDALHRCYLLSEEIDSMAVIVDPLDDGAAAFYGQYGFIPLDNGRMFLPMKTVAGLFKS